MRRNEKATIAAQTTNDTDQIRMTTKKLFKMKPPPSQRPTLRSPGRTLIGASKSSIVIHIETRPSVDLGNGFAQKIDEQFVDEIRFLLNE